MSCFKVILLKTLEEMEFLATMGLLIYLDICLCLTTCTSRCKVSYLLCSRYWCNYSLYLQKFKCNVGKRMQTLKHLYEKQWQPLQTSIHLFNAIYKPIVSKHYPEHFHNKIFLYWTNKRFEVKVQFSNYQCFSASNTPLLTAEVPST